MSSEHSDNSAHSSSGLATSSLVVPVDKNRKPSAYIYSVSRGSLISNSFPSHHHPHAASPVDTPSVIPIAGYDSLPNSGSTSRPSDFDFDLPLDDVPASSTPDLLSPGVSSNSSSVIPSTQKIFAKQLHALLQAILDDQQCDEQESSADGASQSSQDDDHDLDTAPRQEYDSDNIKCITRINDYNDRDGTTSHSSSRDSSNGLEWKFSPQKLSLLFDGIYDEVPLTHQNKRKHDSSHGFSDCSSFDGDSTNFGEEEELLPNKKKARLGKGSTASITTAFSSQKSETASSRKLRSLHSVASSGSFSSTLVKLPFRFEHPIIHPPSDPPHAPKSRTEIAEARIKMLLKREVSYRTQDGLPTGPFETAGFSSDEHEYIFGIEPDFRREVVEWILDILPPRCLDSEDLHEHLKCSEETRFHAMYLFSRFFLRLADCGEQRDKPESKTMRKARFEVTWDVAFCCLAISTKFYHDFLSPLNPICSQHFLAISPQILSHNQFEIIQRDVLDAFNYEVHGLTPHAFFEEFWDALPSLRDILRFRYTRVKIRDDMWDILQIAALQCDIMRFPVSLLTAAALIESILVTLVYEYQKEGERGGNSSAEPYATRMKRNCTKARGEIKQVSQDISTLLGTTIDDLRVCRRWLSRLQPE